MSAPKPTVYATSGSLEGIRKRISQFYGGATITLEERGERRWVVKNANGVVPGVEVVNANFRLKFQKMPWEPEVVE